MQKHAIVMSAALPANAPVEIVANDHRVALLFSPPAPGKGGAHYTVSTDKSVAPGAGLNISPGSGGVLITEELYGDAVRKSWYAVAADALVIGFLEVTRGM